MKLKSYALTIAVASAIILANAVTLNYVVDSALAPWRIVAFNVACLAMPILVFALLSKTVLKELDGGFKFAAVLATVCAAFVFAESVAFVTCWVGGPIRETPSTASHLEKFGAKLVFNGYRNGVGRVFVAQKVVGPIYRIQDVCSSGVGKREISFERADQDHVTCFQTRQGTKVVPI